jgi:hypothetical protein
VVYCAEFRSRIPIDVVLFGANGMMLEILNTPWRVSRNQRESPDFAPVAKIRSPTMSATSRTGLASKLA